MRGSVPPAFCAVLPWLLPAPAAAQQTTRESVDSSGLEADDRSYIPVFSFDGDVMSFFSYADNLVPGDTNGWSDTFVRNRITGSVKRASVSTGGNQGDGNSYRAVLSADGRIAAFYSDATNLVRGDTNGSSDIFVRDLNIPRTTRVSVDSSGAEANSGSEFPAISADGRIVAYGSSASNLVPNDTNLTTDVFVFDRNSHTTTRVSVDASGNEGDSFSDLPSISSDGNFVAFASGASNLVPGDTNQATDIFVVDRSTGAIERVSVDSAGGEGNATSFHPWISGDGSLVAFDSLADNLVAGDTNHDSDVFVRDRANGVTYRVSVDSSGNEADGTSWFPTISADGRFVAFESFSGDLDPADINGVSDIYRHELATGVTLRVSVDSAGKAANGASSGTSMSGDGHLIGFESGATNLVSGDTNGVYDVFVREECDARFRGYGAGWPGTLGIPSITASGDPDLGSTLTITIANSLGATTPALFLLGFAEAAVPTNKGGTLLVVPFLYLPLQVPAAGYALSGLIPNDPTLCGLEVDLQALEVDAGASKGLSFTPGLQLILGT